MWVFLKSYVRFSGKPKALLTLWELEFLAKEVPIDLDIYPNRTVRPPEIFPLLVYIELNYNGFHFQHLLFLFKQLNREL